ncbi:MAG: S1 RNA-binding domain-containing protein, partial [Paludibacteraceae bacterium]|nr:S1 RNA-binding domain-containing protein [Paludibacteraceae bacterium]
STSSYFMLRKFGTSILSLLNHPKMSIFSIRLLCEVEEFSFDPSVQTLDDLHEGMVLPGIVTNVTNFGAFVDVGVHEDGLVHVSQLSDKYVSSPAEVVRLHQHVQVRVMEVDRSRKRISLSMLL